MVCTGQGRTRRADRRSPTPSPRCARSSTSTTPACSPRRASTTDGRAGARAGGARDRRRRPPAGARLAFAEPVRAVATRSLGGGLGLRSWVVNAEVPLEYHHDDPAGHARAIAAELGLGRRRRGLAHRRPASSTSQSCADGGASCDATVGRLDADVGGGAGRRRGRAGTPGTINLVCWVPAPLGDAALVERAGHRHRSQGAGPVRGRRARHGHGVATPSWCAARPAARSPTAARGRSWGARLARAVHGAVATGPTRSWRARVITLVLGGARSGKSAVAERLAARLPRPVTYVATAVVDPDDADHAAGSPRTRARRDRRGRRWRPARPRRTRCRSAEGSVLVDSLGTWVRARGPRRRRRRPLRRAPGAAGRHRGGVGGGRPRRPPVHRRWGAGSAMCSARSTAPWPTSPTRCCSSWPAGCCRWTSR